MKKAKIVLLDAGHGGVIDNIYQTSGKRSPIWGDGSQYFEGEGNRCIRFELSKLLKKAGIKYQYVNEGQKDTRLSERVKLANSIANKWGVENCIGFSIHSNGFSKESANGCEVFTSEGQTGSDEIADAWMEEMAIQFPWLKQRVRMSDGDKDKEDYLYMTAKTSCRWILIESMFHTNEDECKILMSRQGKKKIALALFNTIKRFV